MEEEEIQTPKEEKPKEEPKIDVTANMDNDQKKIFQEMKDRATAIPQHVDTERDFCKRHRALRERRMARLRRR